MNMLRHCKNCAMVKEATDFYASRPTVCKECVRKAVTQHRQANIERIRAYDRGRGFRGKPTHAKDYKVKYPARRAAQIAVNNAVRDGRLQQQLCLLCGERAEAHHTHYDAPLEVVWLCPAHHKQAHAMARGL